MNFYEILLNRGAVGEGMTHFERLFAQAIGGSVKELSGVPPLTFKANGQLLIDWSMSGQTVQASTPTPSSPVAVEGVGTLSGSDYIIPVTCGGTTTNLFLGSATSTRKIKKLVLTGSASENWTFSSTDSNRTVCYIVQNMASVIGLCSHIVWKENYASTDYNRVVYLGQSNRLYISLENSLLSGQTLEAFKTYLAQQYANGTPVTVWYVLATEETGIVNEPLMKIGSYADEITKTGTGVNIPTVNGSNTLSVGTTVQPSNVYIKYHT